MKPLLSICLCTAGQLEYLKILFKGIKRNTEVPYEICVHVNGCEATMQWLLSLEMDNLKISWSNENEGCAAVNYAVGLSDGVYIYNFNDDMYVLPGYDTLVIDMLRDNNTVAPSIIEPHPYYPDITNPIRLLDFGDKYYNFDEDGLLTYWDVNRHKLETPNIYSYIHPYCCTRKFWDKVGGIDTDYLSWCNDWQWAHDVYQEGGKMLQCGKARIYHFSGKTLEKFPDRANLCNEAISLFKKKTGWTGADLDNKIGIGQHIG